jgi:7,8-dihydroneopterin 2',3'-cyclic phosphate phosphodiesterase
VNILIDIVKSYVGMIKDDKLRVMVSEFLVDPPAGFDAPSLPLEICPAGAFQHHCYTGGLLEHTVSMVRIALTLCDIVEEYYGGELDRDVVIASSILHDLMKCYCYEEAEGGGYRGSDFGGHVDHLSLMVGEMMNRGFPLAVVHAVAGHHGDIGPTKPKSLEALIVSLADLVDSELNSKLLRAAEYLLRRCGISKPRVLSSREAVDIVVAKDHDGWEGVRKLINE